MTTAQLSVGELLRDWRERRRRSQLEVAIAADVSARHLSFIETGRSGPSRTMIERLCEELEVPLREVRNYTQWRAHVVGRIRRQLDRTAADGLVELLEDVEGYPAPPGAEVEAPAVTARDGALPVLPLLLRTSLGDLSFLYVLSVIGAPRDVTVDDATREALLAISHE